MAIKYGVPVICWPQLRDPADFTDWGWETGHYTSCQHVSIYNARHAEQLALSQYHYLVPVPAGVKDRDEKTRQITDRLALSRRLATMDRTVNCPGIRTARSDAEYEMSFLHFRFTVLRWGHFRSESFWLQRSCSGANQQKALVDLGHRPSCLKRQKRCDRQKKRLILTGNGWRYQRKTTTQLLPLLGLNIWLMRQPRRQPPTCIPWLLKRIVQKLPAK